MLPTKEGNKTHKDLQKLKVSLIKGSFLKVQFAKKKEETEKSGFAGKKV